MEGLLSTGPTPSSYEINHFQIISSSSLSLNLETNSKHWVLDLGAFSILFSSHMLVHKRDNDIILHVLLAYGGFVC